MHHPHRLPALAHFILVDAMKIEGKIRGMQKLLSYIKKELEADCPSAAFVSVMKDFHSTALER